MSQQPYGERYGGSAAENYERYFVPTIGLPLAKDLVQRAALQPGARVLDAACGTGVVTRLVAEALGGEGSVAGLDVNPTMLAVARQAASLEASIDWYESTLEAVPLPDAAFDVVLCQMGLQFMPDRSKALAEIRRLLAPGGRAVLSVPGPTPRLFAIMAEGLGTHIHPECAGFPEMVFSLHEPEELRQLLEGAGFHEIDVSAEIKRLALPEAKDFLWQYVHCTPLANPVAAATEEQRDAAERFICDRWNELMSNGSLVVDVNMTTVVAA